jgi:hypothetical protein
VEVVLRPAVVRLNEHIHLLPDIDRQDIAIEAVQHLPDSCIHTLGAVAGERWLRYHIRLEAHELQRHQKVTVAAYGRIGGGTGTDLPGVILIDIPSLQKGEIRLGLIQACLVDLCGDGSAQQLFLANGARIGASLDEPLLSPGVG